MNSCSDSERSKPFLSATQIRSFFMAQQPIVGQDLLIIEASRSHVLDTPHSVGLLWTSDQPVADNTQHSHETDIHAACGIQTHNPSKRTAADPRLRPRGHWDGQCVLYDIENVISSYCLFRWYCSDKSVIANRPMVLVG
jgi:hypothetical protein